MPSPHAEPTAPSSRDGRHVTVIGAGIGGLCAAVRLARAGARVHVLEKNPEPGGRCGRLRAGGFTFDLGPTILLVPSVLEELFADAGRDLRDYLRVEALSPNYRVHFSDGTELTLTRDLDAMRAQLERIEPGSFARYRAFLRAGSAQLSAALGRFAVTHYGSLREFATPGTARDLLRARAYTTLAAHVARHFRDERLRMALSFQTMYLGLSPYDAPALYGLLPYTELTDGVFYTQGGLHQIPLALERLARELGVTFEYDRAVTALVPRGGRVAELVLEGGERRGCDVVLANADLPWVYRHLLPAGERDREDRHRYTSSAFMLYLGLDRACPGLLHHNVFFGARFRESFDDIFASRVIPADPSFYVAAPSVTDPTLAPEGGSALYVLVPVPHKSRRVDWSRAEEPLRARVLDRLERTVAPELRRHIVVERRLNPDGWASRCNLQHGAAFGLAHTLGQVGPFRPKNRHATLGNLYFCGASTQPGTGIPLVALSGKLAATRILAEHPRVHTRPVAAREADAPRAPGATDASAVTDAPAATDASAATDAAPSDPSPGDPTP